MTKYYQETNAYEVVCTTDFIHGVNHIIDMNNTELPISHRETKSYINIKIIKTYTINGKNLNMIRNFILVKLVSSETFFTFM